MSYETMADLRAETQSAYNLLSKYDKLDFHQLQEKVNNGEIFRTHIEEHDRDGYYTGTRYYFWATCIHGVHNDLIKTTFSPTLFND